MKCLLPFLMLLALPLAVRAAPAAGTKAAKAVKPAPAVSDSFGLLQRAVAKDSTNFGNLFELGIMYLDREQHLEASRVLAKANLVNPRHVKVLVNLGVALDNLGRSEAAQELYREALSVSPDDSVAKCRLATSIYAQGRNEDAITLLRGLLAEHPRSECGFFLLGRAFADAGLYRDAVRMWRRVLEVSPNSPEAMSASESIDIVERLLSGE